MTGFNSNINLFAHNSFCELLVTHSGSDPGESGPLLLFAPNTVTAASGVYYNQRFVENRPFVIGPSSLPGVLGQSIMHMDHNTFMMAPPTGGATANHGTKRYDLDITSDVSKYISQDFPTFVPNFGVQHNIAISGKTGLSVFVYKGSLYWQSNSGDGAPEVLFSLNQGFLTRNPQLTKDISKHTWIDNSIQILSLPMFVTDSDIIYRGKNPTGGFTTMEEFIDIVRLSDHHPLMVMTMHVSGDIPNWELGDMKIMAMETSFYGTPLPKNSNVPLFLCGSEQNFKCYNYENLAFEPVPPVGVTENKTSPTNFDTRGNSTLRFSPNVTFDTHFKLNEGSGNIIYSTDGSTSGVWQQSHIGEPHWFKGERSTDIYDPLHVAYFRDTGAGDFGIDLHDTYQKAIRIGKAGSEDKNRTFKFDTSAPTGDFTIAVMLTHSGHDQGNILQFIDSGRPFATDFADFRIYGGSGSYSIDVYDSLGNPHSATITSPNTSPGGFSNFGNINVRPLLVATYGGPSGMLNMYLYQDQYKSVAELSGSVDIRIANRRVLNSGDMYMPGINGAFSLSNAPNYYEDVIIIDQHLNPGQIRELSASIKWQGFTGSGDPARILKDRQNPIWPGFDITNKGYVEFDIPMYSGEVWDGMRFRAPNWHHHDSGSLINLSNDPSGLVVKSFVKVETNNPSGILFCVSSPNIGGFQGLDWSGVPRLLPSGEHYIEVTGSFPNGTREFGNITGTGLALGYEYDSQFAGPMFEVRLKGIDQGNNFYTANTKIYGIDVCYSGDYKPSSFDPFPTGVPLFVSGVFLNNSGIDLFIQGNTPSGIMTLHTKAGQINTIDPGNTLFVHGHTDNNSSGTLFVEGSIKVSGDHTLFINGVFTDTRTMNLYIKGNPPFNASGNFPLYMTATSGLTQGFTSVPLFIKSFNNPFPTGSMNLFLSAPATITNSLTNTMNLFMKGLGDESGFQASTKTINMFIQNDAIAHNSGVNLFMSQGGTSSGYTPVSGFMNLFINRRFESVAHNLPMFINGPSGENNNITLFMQAQPNDRSGMSLLIDGIGAVNNPMNLYSHGF